MAHSNPHLSAPNLLSLRWLRILAILTAAAAAGCGGGGGGGTGSTPTPALGNQVSEGSVVVAPAPDPTPDPAPAPTPDEWALAQAASEISLPSLLTTGYLKGLGWLASVTDPQASSAYTPQFTGHGWYVDADNGADTNPGTQQQPWKTLARAVVSRIGAGDALLLKCGGTWRETLEITTSNFSANGQVLVGGYGDCTSTKRPVIKGSDLVSQANWQKATSGSDQVFTKPYSATTIDRLFLDGKPLIKARFPNYSGVGKEFAKAVGNNTDNSFNVEAAELTQLADKSLAGATIYLRVSPWAVEKAVVAQFNASSGLVTLDRSLSRKIESGVGYILEGQRWMLDAAGEWWLDSSAGQLYVWTPTGASPATSTTLEASWRPYGLIARWIPDLRIEQLRFDQQADIGLLLVETPRVTVSGLYSAYVHEQAVSALSTDNALIQDSVIVSAGRIGINVREGNAVRILRNKVSDTGLNGRADTTDSAISALAQATLEGNLVQRSANLGIRFANRPGTAVRNNTVLSSCVRLTDCAGIYTFTAAYPALAPSAYVAAATVDGNMVIGARTNTDGLGPNSTNQAVGIYLDELTSGATISNNTVSDTEVGLALHNAAFNILTHNTVRGSTFSSMRGTLTRSDADVMRGNVVSDNSFITYRSMKILSAGIPEEGSVIYAQYWLHSSNPALFFSGTDANVVSGNQALSVQASSEARWRLGTDSSGSNLNLTQWQAYAPSDTQSSPLRFKSFNANLSGSSLIENSTLTDLGSSSPWVTYFVPGNVGGSFTAASSTLCATSPCGKFTVATTSDFLASSPFTMNTTAGQNLYVLRYTVAGGAGGGNNRSMIRRRVSPYENYGLSIPSTLLANGETATVEQYFRASGAGDDAVLDFRGKVGGETYVSNVTLHNVGAIDFPNLLTLVGHVLNTQASSATYTCVMLGLSSCDVVDDSGQAVAWPLTVPARSTVTLFARNSSWLAQ